jgi:hypothetical protein
MIGGRCSAGLHPATIAEQPRPFTIFGPGFLFSSWRTARNSIRRCRVRFMPRPDSQPPRTPRLMGEVALAVGPTGRGLLMRHRSKVIAASNLLERRDLRMVHSSRTVCPPTSPGRGTSPSRYIAARAQRFFEHLGLLFGAGASETPLDLWDDTKRERVCSPLRARPCSPTRAIDGRHLRRVAVL